MDAEILFELLQREEDKFDRAIICHQYGLAMGDIDLMDLSIWAIVGASMEDASEMVKRSSQCLIEKCNIDAESSHLWAFYYLVSADMLIMQNDYEKKIPPLEHILEHAKSPSLRCLANWTLTSVYIRTDKFHDATRLYEMQLDEEVVSRLKRGKIYALFDLWAALFACDWLLDELQSMGHDDPMAKCLWLFAKGEVAYVMREFSECFNFHQQAIAVVENIEARKRIHDISGVHNSIMETRLEGFLRFIKAKARITSVDYAIKDHGNKEEEEEYILIPVLSPWNIYKGMPHKLGILCAAQIPLFVALRQEKDEVKRAIMHHQCRIVGEGKAEVPGHLQHIHGSDPELLHEKIVRCLVEKCEIEPEESKAWAFYYVAMFLQDSNTLNYLKQSLEYGVSPALRFLASMKCDEVTHHAEKLSYSLERVNAARATTSIRAKSIAFYHLWENLDALAMFKDAKETLKELENFVENDLAKGLSLYCQGKLAFAMGGYKECIGFLNRAIIALEKVKVRRTNFGIVIMTTTLDPLVCLKIAEAEILIWRSQVELEEDNEEEFEAKQTRFWEIMGGSNNDDHHNIYKMDFLEGKVYSLCKKGKLEEAKAILLKILKYSQSHWDDQNLSYRTACRDAYVHAVGLLFTIECEIGNKEEMESLYSEIEKLELHDTAVRDNAAFKAQAYSSMGEYDKAIENLKLALVMDMDAVNRSDLSAMRINCIESHKNRFRKMQAYILLQRGHTLDAVSKALVWAERERARDFMHIIQQKPSVNYLINTEVFDRNDDEALSEILSVSSLTERDTVFIVYSKLPPLTMFSYLVRAGEDPLLFVLKEEEDLKQINMRNLYEVYIEPMEEELEKAKTKRIIFVTTEEMALIPFAALVNSDGKYLIQKYEISIIASLRLFKQCEMRRRYLMERRETNEALVVANPQLDLPFAEKEGDVVADILKKTGLSACLLKGNEATKAAVVTKLPESYWIHMSCHATYADKIPSGALKLRGQLCDMVCNFGALELANVMPFDVDAGRAIKSTKTTRKNLLTAEEVHEGKDLRATVTVLGACSSGTGQVCAEGTLGLARSFHLAGVPTVIASLWSIDDEATSVLMERFYVNMSSGLLVASALRKAMISMIEELDDQTSQPRYVTSHWAPFFISGSPFSSLVGNPSFSSCSSRQHLR